MIQISEAQISPRFQTTDQVSDNLGAFLTMVLEDKTDPYEVEMAKTPERIMEIVEVEINTRFPPVLLVRPFDPSLREVNAHDFTPGLYHVIKNRTCFSWSTSHVKYAETRPYATPLRLLLKRFAIGFHFESG